jgi:hypothetical protein
MALAGHVSRAMMERYSHIRMEAKRAVPWMTSAALILSRVWHKIGHSFSLAKSQVKLTH